MNEQALAKVQIVPISPTLGRHLAEVGKHYPPTIDEQEAREICLDLFLNDADPKFVKVSNGRRKYEDIGDYLGEIEGETIVRAMEIMVQAAMGVRYAKILNGKSFSLLTWLCKQYPILDVARQKMEQMRTSAIAERTLDRLEGIADNEEGNEGARVKACEVLLRATHPAFGSKTEAKAVDDRPVINFNIAAFIGECQKLTASEAKKGRGEVIDI